MYYHQHWVLYLSNCTRLGMHQREQWAGLGWWMFATGDLALYRYHNDATRNLYQHCFKPCSPGKRLRISITTWNTRVVVLMHEKALERDAGPQMVKVSSEVSALSRAPCSQNCGLDFDTKPSLDLCDVNISFLTATNDDLVSYRPGATAHLQHPEPPPRRCSFTYHREHV